MKSKKANFLWSAVLYGSLAVFVFIIIVGIDKTLLGKGTAQAEELLSGINDEDEDEVPDLFDTCPCIPYKTDDLGGDGCPENPTDSQKKDRSCFNKNKKK